MDTKNLISILRILAKEAADENIQAILAEAEEKITAADISELPLVDKDWLMSFYDAERGFIRNTAAIRQYREKHGCSILQGRAVIQKSRSLHGV